MQELRFTMKHMERKSNEVIFKKCVDPRCDHCSSRPIISTAAWDFIKERDFVWPNPIPSPTYENHYMTFLEMCEIGNEFLITGNAGLPCSIDIGCCPFCDAYVFLSETEKKRHLSVFHQDKKGTHSIWKREHRCLYVLAVNAGKTRCNLIFKSANQLKEHRLKEKHHNKGKSSKKPERKKGAQLRMEDMLEDTTKNVEVVNNEEEETSEECQICKSDDPDISEAESDESDTEAEIEWVKCDANSCDKWYHQVCVDRTWPDNPVSKRKKWFCCK